MSPKICPNILSHGACTTEGCIYKHDIHLCQTCRVVCNSAYSLAGHLRGKKHGRRVRAQAYDRFPTFCKLCNVSFGSANYPDHIRGKMHQFYEEQQGDDTDASSEPESLVPPGQLYCEICDQTVPDRVWSSHTTGYKHKKKERFAAVQAAFDEADKDKHGITVSSFRGENELDFGFLEWDPFGPQPAYVTQCTVLLTTPGRILVSEIRLSSSHATRPRVSSFSVEDVGLPARLRLQKPLEFDVTFDHPGFQGRFNDRLEIVFQDAILKTQFVITRSLTAVVGNREDWELIKPSAPYKPKRQSKKEPEKEVVPGVKPPQLASIEWVVSLPESPVPKSLEALLANPRAKVAIGNLKRTWLPHQLDSQTYGRHFHVLLYIEETQMNIDIQRYDEEDVPLEPVPPYYRLPVPGLAEKRPSVIVGDRILVQNCGSKKSDHWFEGRVHRARSADVDLKFHPSFNSYRGQKYNVRFKLGRLPLRRMHQALSTAFAPERVLFPSQMHVRARVVPTRTQLDSIRVVNRLIETNPPQLLAVATILHMPEGSVPFVLFGPPGTGKTVTVVEAIRQILLKDEDARIMACAPSNSAADIIASRLSNTLSPRQLFRLNAPSRSKDSMPQSLTRFSQTNSEGTFSVPPVEILSQFSVIVSTCISASVPYGMGMERGHFTHIFLDEAGQACEPEAMIPIKTMADNKTNIIVSGDPKQLGPIVRSTIASSLGLGVSYLDRLTARDIYDVAKGKGICIVKLIKNWRSHETILEYPNEKFYKGELEAHGDVVVTHSLLRSHELVTPGYPIVFHAITGRDMRESNSPSFFNADEAFLAKQYVDRLRTDQRLKLKDEHIGMITPYHAQVIKIRTLLKKNYAGVKVGSVEEFQGQERRVIIISTVRSSIDFVEFDVKHTLGFVASPRRFNVAITRAQALLIIIGDPSVLSLDPLWRGFMNSIYIGGGWKGPAPDWDVREPVRLDGGYDADRRRVADTDIERLIERTKTLILENSEMLAVEGAEDEGEEAHVDQPWREAE